MAYSIHLRVHEDKSSQEEARELLDEYARKYEDAEMGNERTEKSVDPGIVISGATLAIATIDTLVTIYSELKSKPEVHRINLYGPNSERIPVQVYTDAIDRIENPGRYEIHEVDEDVTLVLCDSVKEIRKVQADVDPDGLVEDLDEEIN